MVDLYKDFQCSADACLNTCCAGWKIIIDEKTYEKMVNHQDQLGIPAEDWIKRDENNVPVAKLDKRLRCPMLNEKNLCKVVLDLGPEYLCETCTIYPRVLRTYGDVIEGFLKLSCPEVVFRLMEKQDVQFDLASDDNPASPFPYVSLYCFEAAIRTNMVKILQFPADVSLVTKLFVSYDILDRAVRFCEEKRMDISLLQTVADRYFQKNSLYLLDDSLRKGVNEEDRYQFLKGILPSMYDENGYLHNCYILALKYFVYGNVEQYRNDMENLEHIWTSIRLSILITGRIAFLETP